MRAWLFFVSYAPLALIFGLRALPDWRAAAVGIGYFIVFVALAAVLLKAQRRSSARPVNLEKLQEQGGAVSGYLATYLLPFLSTAPEDAGDWLGYCVYFLVALIVFSRSDLALVNPTLYVLGYRVTKANDGRREVLVISRKPLVSNTVYNVTDLLDVYVVKS